MAPRIATVRGLLQLGVAGTVGVASLAEAVHRVVWGTAPLPLLPASALARGLTGVVYGSVRGAAGLVGKGGDALLAQAERWAGGDPEANDAPTVAMPLGLRSAVNGVLGDRLARMGNPVALPMSLEPHGRLRAAGRSGRAGASRVVFIHGLCMNDQHWQDATQASHCFGERLHEAHGHQPLYLRYNSGLAIAENGRRLATLLEARHVGRGAWRGPLHVVAHSLGGLIIRSALAEAYAQGHSWPTFLGDVVFLGTPHEGAPLERIGKTIDSVLAATRYSAPWAAVGRLRSVAIHQLGRAEVAALPPESRAVRFHALAGTVHRRPAHRVAPLVGDGLVPLRSALGEGVPEAVLRIDHRTIFAGVGHLALVRHPDVADYLVTHLGNARGREAPRPRPRRRTLTSDRG